MSLRDSTRRRTGMLSAPRRSFTTKSYGSWVARTTRYRPIQRNGTEATRIQGSEPCNKFVDQIPRKTALVTALGANVKSTISSKRLRQEGTSTAPICVVTPNKHPIDTSVIGTVSPMPTAGSSSATARPGSGPSPTSVSPMRSRSSTSSTPKATSGTSPRPSTHPGPNSPRSGRNNDGTNSMPAASAPSSPPSPTTPQPATRPANASTISSATVSACAMPRSGPGACALPPASSRLAANLPSGRASSAPACTGPSTAPMPSSPCAAASSADASKPSGNDETPPHNAALTNLTCTPGPGVSGSVRAATHRPAGGPLGCRRPSSVRPVPRADRRRAAS